MLGLISENPLLQRSITPVFQYLLSLLSTQDLAGPAAAFKIALFVMIPTMARR